MEKSFQNLSKSRTSSARKKNFLNCQNLAIVVQLKKSFQNLSKLSTSNANRKSFLKLSKSSY